MDVDQLAKELAKFRAVFHRPDPAGSECEDCAGTGVILVTHDVPDYDHGGYQEEHEELCETCLGEGI